MGERGEGLIPLSQRSKEEQEAIRSKTKGSSSEKRKRAQQLIHSKYAKCKNCKVDCTYKKERIVLNADSVCACPNLRVKAIRDELPIGSLNKTWLDGNLDELLNLFRHLYQKALNQYELYPDKKPGSLIREMNLLWTRLMETRKELYPVTQQIESMNVNVNVEGDMAEKVLRRIAERKLVEEIGVKVVKEEENEYNKEKESNRIEEEVH